MMAEHDDRPSRSRTGRAVDERAAAPPSPDPAGTAHPVARHDVMPAGDLFERIRRQAALLAVAEHFRRDPSAVGRAAAVAFHDYAIASDQVLAVSGPVEAATLGWMRPVGVVALLATAGCSDEHVVEHLAACLAAMNGVAFAVDEPQRSRLAPLLDELDRLLPAAFVELEPGPDAVYPVGVSVVGLTPVTLYRATSAPIALPVPGRSIEERLEILAVHSRICEVGVDGVRVRQ